MFARYTNIVFNFFFPEIVTKEYKEYVKKFPYLLLHRVSIINTVGMPIKSSKEKGFIKYSKLSLGSLVTYGT